MSLPHPNPARLGATLRQLALASLVSAAALPAVVRAQQPQDCGTLATHYGPFDYRVNRDKLPIVERYHFSKKVETLRGGDTAAGPGPDLDYTLGAFPNHHRALVAVTRYANLTNTRKPKDMKYTVDCYFERALRFSDGDAVVRMLYANWLGDTDRRDAGLQQLDKVEPGDSPLTTYNLGLVYAELGGYDKALTWAHKADELGYLRPALKEMLEKAGRWREPSAPDASASAASAAPAGSSPASAAN